MWKQQRDSQCNIKINVSSTGVHSSMGSLSVVLRTMCDTAMLKGTAHHLQSQAATDINVSLLGIPQFPQWGIGSVEILGVSRPYTASHDQHFHSRCTSNQFMLFYHAISTRSKIHLHPAAQPHPMPLLILLVFRISLKRGQLVLHKRKMDWKDSSARLECSCRSTAMHTIATESNT